MKPRPGQDRSTEPKSKAKMVPRWANMREDEPRRTEQGQQRANKDQEEGDMGERWAKHESCCWQSFSFCYREPNLRHSNKRHPSDKKKRTELVVGNRRTTNV